MTTVTDHDPSEMSKADLAAEWQEAFDRIHFTSTDDDERESLWDRRRDLWNEMKARTDADAPECPECGGQRWSQEFGGPKHCAECDFHPTGQDMDLVDRIDTYWEQVQSPEGGASA